MNDKRFIAPLVALLMTASTAAAGAEAQATPFKLGTFQAEGRDFVGLVLRDVVVLDIAAANAQYERANAAAPRLIFPASLNEVIARYDAEFAPRLRALAAANATVENAPYVRRIDRVKILPPVRPAVILNAGANYPEHAAGIVEQNARAATQAHPADRDRLHRDVLRSTKQRMLREMAEALEALTAEVPLVLVLEDLHWGDYSTLDLIASLARRREPARLRVPVLREQARRHGHRVSPCPASGNALPVTCVPTIPTCS